MFLTSIFLIFRSNIWGPWVKLKNLEASMLVTAIANMNLLSASFSFKASGFSDFRTYRLDVIEVLSMVLIIML